MANLLSELDEHLAAMEALRPLLENEVPRLAGAMGDVLDAGGRIFAFGNGGSAADAQHLASEIVGKFETNRRGLPAFALTTDASVLTSLSNDFGYTEVFARQVEALAGPADLVLGLSTSGESPNVLRGLLAARERGCRTAALLGRGGGSIREAVDFQLVIPHGRTARVQEAHVFLIHALCLLLDERFTE